MALDNLEVPFDPNTWAVLENRLDALPSPDALDKALRPALDRIETSYDPGSWSALSSRMDGIARVRRIRMMKLAEAAIFLLLLLNLKGFFGVVESVTKPVPVRKEVPGPIANVRNAKAKKTNPTQVISDTNSGSVENQSIASQVFAFVKNLTNTLIPDPENSSINTPTNTPQPIAANQSVLDPTNFYSHSGLVKFPVGPVLPALPTEQVLFASNGISIPGIEIPKYGKTSHLYAASFGSFDKNYHQEGNYRNQQSGYGGGIAIGYRKGKWGVETGITYTQKSYQPEKVKELYQYDPITGSDLFYIDDVDANVFSIPIKATRRIAKVGKTTAHAVAGVTANYSTTKRYGYKTVHFPPITSSDPITIEPLPEGKGVFENGGLTHNAYATADLGLRVEQPLGKRYIAFVEPIYRQSLGGGLGPKASRLSTFSFQAGVMASL